MIGNQLKNTLNSKACTLLGIGPMSLNCVDASIDLATKYDIPLILIASRRQIDSKEFGGGYVNNWTTSDYSNYVINADKKGKIILARDHGGPWQNEVEKENSYSLRRAMESAKASYKEDIDSGFQILHIDPSIDIHSNPKTSDVLERIYELYEFCYSYAKKIGREVLFEIGTEEQSGSTNTQEELNFTLEQIQRFCKSNKLPKPTFVVIQTGTRVLEMRNVGSFDNPLRVENEIPAEIQVPKMVQICKEHSIFMKEHNADYLSDEAIQWHPRLGIHSANVAPEFGVTESKAFIKVLEDNNLPKLADEFIKLSLESKKWEKWLIPKSNISERDKALLCGHYIFSKDEFINIKNKANSYLEKKGISLDNYLKESIQKSILRYLKGFNLIK